jgi:undecaprenyl pyrophosphate phosphatase UppP
MEPKTYEIVDRVQVDGVEKLHEALSRVRSAQKVFATYTQEQVDKIFLAAASAAAYLVSRAAIRFLLDFVTRRGFAAFGVYRIVLGVVVLAYFLLK